MKGHILHRHRKPGEGDPGKWALTIFAIFGMLWIVGMVATGFVHFKPPLSASVEAVPTATFDGPRAPNVADLRLPPHADPQGSESHPEPQSPTRKFVAPSAIPE